MKKMHGGFTTSIVIAVVAVLIIGAGIYLYIHRGVKGGSSASGTASIVITDSGSTNTGAFTITVNPDGSGERDFKGDANEKAAVTTFPPESLDYIGLEQSIGALHSLQWADSSCAKSASFGTTVQITYMGETSSDITCMPSGAVYDDLMTNVNKIKTETSSSSN